ncbi:hypothetical protein CVULP_0806 [Campylobacter vulpis]|nr:hypothetical protein CVULP_0806 [Campylobacter vulpis]
MSYFSLKILPMKSKFCCLISSSLKALASFLAWSNSAFKAFMFSLASLKSLSRVSLLCLSNLSLMYVSFSSIFSLMRRFSFTRNLKRLKPKYALTIKPKNKPLKKSKLELIITKSKIASIFNPFFKSEIITKGGLI